MATSGTMIFSHIIPVILGFVGLFIVANSIYDDNRELLIIGIILFVVACFSPFILLRAFI